MTTALDPQLETSCRQLVSRARDDLGSAMTQAIPWVLSHPDGASILSELGVIAGQTEEGLVSFRTAVGELVRIAVRADADVVA